jgi:hypothetical protein
MSSASLARFDFVMACIAEKYRRYPPNDPLYRLAHQALPSHRLKRSNWQHRSDQVLRSTGFYAARLDVRSTLSQPSASSVCRTTWLTKVCGEHRKFRVTTAHVERAS